MLKVKINNIIKEIKPRTPLKSILDDFAFPCKGKGLCGKCKVQTKNIAVSPKDKIFLSKEEIEKGYRIACDKAIVSDCEVIYTPNISKNAILQSIEYCTLFLILDCQNMVIGILDNDLIEIVTFDYKENDFLINDIFDPDLGKRLKSKFSHIAIDLLEKYSIPQAETILITGVAEMVNNFKGVSPQSLYTIDYKMHNFDALSENGDKFDLPTEDVYFLPSINGYIGSDILSALYYLEANQILVDLTYTPIIAKAIDDTYLIAPFYGSKGEDVIKHINKKNASLEVIALQAGIKYFAHKGINTIAYRGCNQETLSKIVHNFEFVDINSSVIEFTKQATLQNKFKTYANKIRRKTNVIDLKEISQWQDIFSSLSLV